MENPGIDPGTSRMLSERSTIWANSPTAGKVIGRGGNIIQQILEKARLNSIKVIGDDEARTRGISLDDSVSSSSYSPFIENPAAAMLFKTVVASHIIVSSLYFSGAIWDARKKKSYWECTIDTGVSLGASKGYWNQPVLLNLLSCFHSCAGDWQYTSKPEWNYS